MEHIIIVLIILPFIKVLFFPPKYKSHRRRLSTALWFLWSWFAAGLIYLIGGSI